MTNSKVDGPGDHDRTGDAGGEDPSDGFRRIPSVTIQNGRVVLAGKGEYIELTPDHPLLGEMGGGFTKPSRRWGWSLAIFELLFQDFPLVYVLDLDSIQRGSPQLDLLRRVAALGSVWVDGGLSFAEHGMDYLMVGVDGMVMATKTMRNLDELEEATGMFEDVIVSIDYDGALISRSARLREMGADKFAVTAAGMGISRFVLADLRTREPDPKLTGRLARVCPVLYVGGGVREGHTVSLAKAGAAGAILELRDVLDRLDDDGYRK